MQMRELLDRIDQLNEQQPPADTPAPAVQAPVDMRGKWPASASEVKAYQTSKGLKPDGLIGKNTLAALQADGAAVPANFVPVGPKQIKKAGTDASGQVPIPAGGVPASTPAQATAANAQQAPQGSDTTTAGEPSAATTAAPATSAADTVNYSGGTPFTNPTPGSTSASTATNQPPASGSPFTNPTPAATTTATTQPAAPAATSTVSATPNPWAGKDPVKAQAWAALSPEDQKWLGNADPTDKAIMSRAPSAGSFGQQVSQNFQNTKSAIKNKLGIKEDADFVRMMELAGIEPGVKKKVLSKSVVQESVTAEAITIPPFIKEPLKKGAQWVASKFKKPSTAPTAPTRPLSQNQLKTAQQGRQQAVAAAEAEAKQRIAKATAEIKELEAEAARRNLPPGEVKKALTFLLKGSYREAKKILSWPFNNPVKTLTAGTIATIANDYANSPETSLASYLAANTVKLTMDAAKSAGGEIAKQAPTSAAADVARKMGVAPPQAYKDMSAEKQEDFKNWTWGIATGQNTIQQAPLDLQKPIEQMLPALQGLSSDEINQILDALPDSKPGGAAPKAPAAAPAPTSTAPSGNIPGQIPSHTQRSQLWQTAPGEDWAGTPQRESAIRIFTKNPDSGQLMEVRLPNAYLKTTKNRTLYFEHYNCGTVNKAANTWTAQVWIKESISKIIKGL